VILAKMAESIKMLFGEWTRVGPSNRVLDRVQTPDPHGKKSILRGRKG